MQPRHQLTQDQGTRKIFIDCARTICTLSGVWLTMWIEKSSAHFRLFWGEGRGGAGREKKREEGGSCNDGPCTKINWYL